MKKMICLIIAILSCSILFAQESAKQKNTLDDLYNIPIRLNKERDYKIKLRTGNLIAGTSMIGASVGTYLIIHSSINSRIQNKNRAYLLDVASLDSNLSKGHISNAQYSSQVAKLTSTLNDDIDRLNKNDRTYGYVCGGISLAGVIVVLTGIHRDYGANGYKISENTYINNTGTSVQFCKTF